MTREVHPKTAEVEVSFFGPGYGESIVIHLGNNEWMIVDSCVEEEGGTPSSLKYLRHLKIDPARAVKIVVATHWHDDHIRGLSEIYRECKSAKFCCSMALSKEQFKILTYLYGDDHIGGPSGLKEFKNIFEIRRIRKKNGETDFNYSIANRRIWFREQRLPSEPKCEIYALSPADIEVELALKKISSLIPVEGEPKRKIGRFKPNYAAVVLWISVGNTTILLGADLEKTKDPGTGWSTIVSSKEKPSGKASVFKIPHHGSSNADYPSLWSIMLFEQPFAILTPFDLGRTKLPKKTDVRRICRRTPHAYSTSSFSPTKKRKIPSSEEIFIKEHTSRFEIINNNPGHVRLRKDVYDPEPGNWSVLLGGDAIDLKNIFNRK